MATKPQQIGKLDQRVTLLHRGLVDDGMGGSVQSLVEYATVWASVTLTSGQERQESQRTEAWRLYMVKVRNRSDVKETDVARWRGRDMNVRVIRDAGPRPLYLELECEMGARI